MGVLETRFGKDGEIKGGRTTIDLETITNILASMGVKEVNRGYFAIDGQKPNIIMRISTNSNGNNGSNGYVYFARTRPTGIPYLKVLTRAIEEIRKIREAREIPKAQLVGSGLEMQEAY